MIDAFLTELKSDELFLDLELFQLKLTLLSRRLNFASSIIQLPNYSQVSHFLGQGFHNEEPGFLIDEGVIVVSVNYRQVSL